MRLESLHIKNYKLFKDLEIRKLGQVNLITGKNNTGKTILLEALRIWASEGDASVVNNIIWKRGDWDEANEVKTYNSLFNSQDVKNDIRINKLRFDISIEDKYMDSFGVYEVAEMPKKMLENGGVVKSLPIIDIEEEIRRLNGELISNISIKIGNKEYPQDKAIFVPASIDFDNKFLWERIVKERKKAQVIKVLQSIDSKINDIEIIDKQALIGLENTPNLIPLKNFGEGLNRLLTIAMALVSAEDNLLLIDEIDTGLHYSVLEKLWEIIFEFADKLNTQVFITTHSWDCISAFSYVYNRNEKNKEMGNYFRLRRSREDDSVIEPVYYSDDQLEDALISNIETR